MPYWVSMLSRGQASPLQVHEKAMRATLRYLKTVAGYYQLFPRQSKDELRLCAFVDASWGSERSVSRRSISGGCIMLGRACIKSWSRPQQAVALSSAESELYALVEGSKEALGVRCAIGHIFDNLVSLKPQIFCDSEAAVNISKMEGLRKLRHIELRSCFVQSEVQMGNILVVSIKGEHNPADLHTKNLDIHTTVKHMKSIGLVEFTLPKFEKGATAVASALQACVARGEVTSLLERGKWKQGSCRWLMIEFCAPLLSTVSRVAVDEFPSVHVVTVTESDDARRADTVAALKSLCVEAIRQNMRVYLWSSTPCTGGCPYQRMWLQNGGEAQRARVSSLLDTHRKLWKSLLSLVPFVHAWSIEWPWRCQYWTWNQTRSFLEGQKYPIYECMVEACALNMRGRDELLIRKQWKVVCTLPQLAKVLDVTRCTKDHRHSERFDLRATQHYPESLCKIVLRIISSL